MPEQKQGESSPQRITVAMAQILVEGGEPEKNLKRAGDMIELSAEQSAHVVVLPECLDVGWTHPSAKELAEPIPGPRSSMICEAAKARSMYVAAGLTERWGERIYNTAILASPNGKLLIKYRKINVLTIAQDLYSIGDRIMVAHTPLGTIGVNICADNFADSLELGHALGRMGTQIILSPCAWAHDAAYAHEPKPGGSPEEFWTPGYSALARLYEMPVIGVSNVGMITAGVWEGRPCCGSSLAVGPTGRLIARAPYGVSAEALILVEAEIRPRTVRGTAISEALREKGYSGAGP